MFFTNSCIFAEFPLDPCDEIRPKEDELDRLKNDLETRFIVFQNGNPLMVKGDNNSPYYVQKAVCEGDMVFLGKDKEQAYFAGKIGNSPAPEGGKFVDMRTIAKETAAEGFSSIPSLLARGKMLLDWHNRHQFCANCGNSTQHRRGGYVRHCSVCDTEHYPRVDPVVIMMVTYEDKCLLGRGRHFLPGMYSALAGFMEPGETIEEAVRREVYEEAGIKVGDVKYIKSQPWPFPSSLMIGVTCEALNNEIKIDSNELEDAKWFDRGEVEKALSSGGNDELRVPDKLAIARHLLEVHLLEHWVHE